MQQGHVIREQVQQEVFAIARKTLQDLASEALEQRVCDLFVERLRGLDAAQRAALASTVGADAAPVQVRSAFELATPQREAMTAALHEVLGQDQPVQYSCSPALVSGIELLGGGHKIDWNIGDYLDAMENKVAQRLQQLGEPGADDAAPVAAGDGAAEVEQESATAPSDPGGATAGEGAVADAGHSR
jgi:F-type H+-transporting ATPase subunit b